MAEENKYRYCMSCRVRYKSNGEPGQTCSKCGALLADTPTGVNKAAPAPKAPAPKAAQPVAETKSEPTPVEQPATQVPAEFSCTAGDVILCLIHNILTGIPVLGLFWCGFSLIKNPLKNRVSKGTVTAGLIANVFSAILLILLATVFKS